MSCPHLKTMVSPASKGKVCVCTEVERANQQYFYNPTSFQIQEYCKGVNFRRCPFFIVGQIKKGEIINNVVRESTKKVSAIK